MAVEMAVDRVLLRAAKRCRQLALLTRTDAARQQLLRLADNFEAGIQQRGEREEIEPVEPSKAERRQVTAATDQTNRAA
jgi:hypothetical protein